MVLPKGKLLLYLTDSLNQFSEIPLHKEQRGKERENLGREREKEREDEIKIARSVSQRERERKRERERSKFLKGFLLYGDLVDLVAQTRQKQAEPGLEGHAKKSARKFPPPAKPCKNPADVQSLPKTPLANSQGLFSLQSLRLICPGDRGHSMEGLSFVSVTHTQEAFDTAVMAIA